MNKNVGAVASLIFATSVFGGIAPAQASSVVQVTLWDKGAESAMSSDKGIGMGDMKMSDTTMGLKLSTETVSAGKVTFRVTNASKDLVHEMIVVPYPGDQKQLPYQQQDSRFDEDAAGHMGEVSELDPGKEGELTLDLKPGKYVLSCNVPGHYMNGMWKILFVK